MRDPVVELLTGSNAAHRPAEPLHHGSIRADGHGISVDELAAETLSASLAADAGVEGDPLEAFIGSGDSGDPAWAARPTAELRGDAAARRTG